MAVYFEQKEGQPVIDDLIFSLAGICDALDAEEFGLNMDYNTVCRIGNLHRGAMCMSKQLVERLSFKPPRARRRANRLVPPSLIDRGDA